MNIKTFVETKCEGKEYDSCANSHCRWSSINGCQHPEHPDNTGERCWLCGGIRPDTTIEVNCETPGGTPCKTKKVEVHHGCYMDMEP